MPRRPRCLLYFGPLAILLLVLPACREAPQPALDPQALFPVEENGQWGYVTARGRLAIAPQFDRAYRFVDNRALIRTNGHFGYIDTTGSVVIPPSYARAGFFSEGLAPIQRDGLWGFIDRAGTLVIQPRFGLDTETSALVPADSGRRRSSPNNGADTLLVPSGFAEGSYFSEGHARIRTDRKWGYIDRSGSIVIPPRFDRAWPFRNGRARVRLGDGEMGYVTPTGTLAWPSAPESASSRTTVSNFW
jgi:hypothetical protein